MSYVYLKIDKLKNGGVWRESTKYLLNINIKYFHCYFLMRLNFLAPSTDCATSIVDYFVNHCPFAVFS